MRSAQGWRWTERGCFRWSSVVGVEKPLNGGFQPLWRVVGAGGNLLANLGDALRSIGMMVVDGQSWLDSWCNHSTLAAKIHDR